MIKVYDTKTNSVVGSLTEAQLQFLIDWLEEEYIKDQDYAFTEMTLAYLVEQGADAQLSGLLRNALSGQEEVILRWSRESG